MRKSEHVEPEDKAGVAGAEEGLVILDGPDGVAVTMTADAAQGTARALSDAAGEASGQKPGPKPR